MTLLVAIGFGAALAGAHTQFVSSSPVDGATLAAPPPEVSFTFDEDLLPGTSTMSINDDLGNVVANQPVAPDGATITVPWPAQATAGTFQVAYRVVSDDGHPITGAITLTITGEAATAVATPSATVLFDEPPPEPRGIAAWLVVVIALLLLALAACAGVALIQRRRP